MTEFDTGKLIAEIISANAETLFDTSKKFILDKTNQIKAKLSSTFSDYIANIERKYSSTKTIIYRDTPQSIKKFYDIEIYSERITEAAKDISNLMKRKDVNERFIKKVTAA